MSVLGIDVGTGGTRAVVVDRDGQVVASATKPHEPFATPQAGWAEQDPSDWWRACTLAVREVLGRVPRDPVVAVGLSGQMHGAVVLDEHDEVLRPSLIWCDQRTGPQCEALVRQLGEERLVELTSNPALTAFTLPKLLWIRDNEPDVWRRVRRVLLPKDYVRLRLTGEHATDVADASGTLLFDVANRRWSAPMVEAAGLDMSLLPTAYESPEVTGQITAEAAETVGLAAGTPVVAGAGDQAAGAVGMGVVRPGAVSATIGTSGVVFAATDEPTRDPRGRIHSFCHAAPARWHVMGVTQAAGLSLRWFAEQFGPGQAEDLYERLTAEAASAPPGSDGVLWAPYLLGERTPHLDPDARAALVGLSAAHRRGHVVRAILEGVAFSLRDTLAIFDELSLPVDSIRLGGGGARSALWRQIQADVYGREVEVIAVDEGAAYGAAVLAGVGAGIWPSVEDACDAVVTVAARVPPDAEAAAILASRYGVFRQLYGVLRPLGR
ncbi:MAG TPA: xylulokinase [Thermoleophilaceae bacterium]|nr:xylulokinase [Thermoleophilaceae bacterium]